MKGEKLPGISSSANLYQVQTQPNELGGSAVQDFEQIVSRPFALCLLSQLLYTNHLTRSSVLVFKLFIDSYTRKGIQGADNLNLKVSLPLIKLYRFFFTG